MSRPELPSRPSCGAGTGWRLSRLESILTLLHEVPDIHPEWRRLVVAHAVTGARAYDARLVAAMNVHGLSAVLTFNVDDFRRYPGVQVVHPQDVTARTP